VTKVDIRFKLQAPPTPAQLTRLAETRGVYGILDLTLDEAAGTLHVEYDASRLNPQEVEGVLRRAGLPVVRVTAS
jgi:allophanate hydrolase subunit 1